jgi:hypothetical protein
MASRMEAQSPQERLTGAAEDRRTKVERNLEREKRKMEWKKLKILAKEKLNEERL